MELKEVIGRRPSMRYLRPYKAVERTKVQKMLEAARLASFWGNVQALGAVVIESATAPANVLAALPTGTAIGGCQFRLARVVEELAEAKVLQPSAPLSYRREELRWLQEQYGLTDIFGDEVPEILREMMSAASESDGAS